MPKNKKYYVVIEETTCVTYEVEATSVQEAKEKVKDGRGDMVEQDHTGSNDPEDWEVEEVEE